MADLSLSSLDLNDPLAAVPSQFINDNETISDKYLLGMPFELREKILRLIVRMEGTFPMIQTSPILGPLAASCKQLRQESAQAFYGKRDRFFIMMAPRDPVSKDPKASKRWSNFHLWPSVARKYIRMIDITIQVVPESPPSIWLSPLFDLKSSGFHDLHTINVYSIESRDWEDREEERRLVRARLLHPAWFQGGSKNFDLLHPMWYDPNDTLWSRYHTHSFPSTTAREEYMKPRREFRGCLQGFGGTGHSCEGCPVCELRLRGEGAV
ncbi:hypothetical protein K402DRAFT_398935 [Aulographum hederae CBS 113979]|uniref:F-box domain-containing protein n=1 Tax=Aulographum hederae CBS 113979 TaxID=1176131 RepID=A0A6G1GJK9_9PEZI|nr:hypothetical protein K402DRAFT_398935 [Aulographum hederae CBS 113979]